MPATGGPGNRVRANTGAGSGTRRRSAAAALLTGCRPASAAGAGGTVTLDFLQFEPEAVAAFGAIAEDFEAKQPRIDVEQHRVPDSGTRHAS